MGRIDNLKEMLTGKQKQKAPVEEKVEEGATKADFKKELQFLDNVPWDAPDDPELQQYLEPSKPYQYSQYDKDPVRDKTAELLVGCKTPKEFVVKIWNWMKDEWLWVYEPPLPLVQVLEAGEANCMNRVNMLVTMARLAKIPAKFKFFKYYTDLVHGTIFPMEVVEGMPINSIIHISFEVYLDGKWVNFDNWDDRRFQPYPLESNGEQDYLALINEAVWQSMGEQTDLIADVLNQQFREGGLNKKITQQVFDPFTEWIRSLSDADLAMLHRQSYGDERAVNGARQAFFSALGMTFLWYTRYELDIWNTKFNFNDVEPPEYKPAEPTIWPMELEIPPRKLDRKLSGKLGQDPRSRRKHPLADFEHAEIVKAKIAAEREQEN